MKKIYSYVLMVAMLLVGADAWAANVEFGGTSQAELQDAIDDAADGTTLIFQNDVTLEKPVWLGTEELNGTAKSITLDLNGHSVSMTGSSSKTAYYMFVLTHGELKIVNSNQQTESLIQLTGQSSDGTEIFEVSGSYRSSRWNEDGNAPDADSINTRDNGYFSHLEIGDNVKIVIGSNCLGTAICINSVVSHHNAVTDKTIKYFTDIFTTSSYGYAYGARVDLYGDIEVLGISSSNYKAYGIKVNGTVRSPKEAKEIRTTKMNGEDNNYLINYVANRAGHVFDSIDAPFIHVYESSKIVTNNGSTKSAAIYASGYAKWLIEGTCEGNIGVSISSGSVTLNNADVTSTATTYTPPTSGNSVSGSGSALVVNSRDAYPGDVEVTISGDTEVSAGAGYGIEEAVNTKGETKVDAITITGGTVVGGDAGTVCVSDKTAESDASITITGVTIEVDEGDAGSSVQIGKESLTEFLNNQTGTHTTTIVNGDGTETIVVSQGEAPTGQESVIAAAEDASVNWKHADDDDDAEMAETLTSNKNLDELEINQSYPQTLTVPTGMTLNVGRVVLGKFAKIIVQPGATFIVSGTQGISSSSNDCVVIQNSETSQGTFLINPDVTSNTQPRATVNMIVTEAGKVGEDYYWHRFAMPVKALTSAWTKSPNYGTYLYGWDYTANDWAALAGGSTDMVPWKGYTLSFNEAPTEITYTFKGQLLGNIDAGLKFQAEGYNFFGNSYTGYIDAKTLVEGLVGKNIRGTIYMWDENNQNYSAVTWNNLVNNEDRLDDFEKEVASMQTFILQLAGANTAEETIDYSSAVWGNPRYGLVALAPARRALAQVGESEANMKIIVTAESGKSEFVTFERINSMSDAYDDGYDANKFMNSNHFNMYATVDGENYTSVVTDNLIGKKLTINTQNDVNYTMTFKFVEGESYAIRDNMTNEVIAITNGNSYSFSAQPNTKIDGRFEIVNLEKVYTGVEDVDTNKDVRGVYTLLGQYVGEDFNALPAGVYIINGVKVVK